MRKEMNMSIFSGFGSAAKAQFSGIIRAREARVERDVHAFLASLDDATLAKGGFNRSSLKKGGTFTGF